MKWEIGAVPIMTADGLVHVPGWLAPPFAVDARIDPTDDEPVWVITHIATGHSAMAICEPVEGLQKAIDLLLSLGDWEFTDAIGAKAYKGCAVLLRENGIDVRSPVGTVQLAGLDRLERGQ